MRKKLLRSAGVAFTVLLVSSSMALAADNWLGTWKLNVEKSTYSPGPAMKSWTLKFEATPAGINLTSDGVDAEGKATHGGYVSKFDGQEVRNTANPNAETVTPTRLDDNSYQNVWKVGGKVTITVQAVVSKDGKTLTIKQTGKNAKGEAVNNVLVYDRQ
jgi:hypothetical protein